jgi:hypothetical protein
MAAVWKTSVGSSSGLQWSGRMLKFIRHEHTG